MARETEVKPISSILGALEAYDGCEVDVRLTRDRVPVLHHDSRNAGRRLMETDFASLRNVPTLRELVSHPQMVRLVNEKGKTLWIEAKEDTTFRWRKDPGLCKEMAQRLIELLGESEIRMENLRIISFCAEILKHIQGIRTLRIVPYLFSPADDFVPHYNHRTFLDLVLPLQRHILKARAMGIRGLLFSKLYLRGFFSFFQPSWEKIKSWARDDFILGTEAQTFEEEKAFKDFVVITDYRGERKGGRGEGDGPLICHRGL